MHLPKGCNILSDSGLDTDEFKNQTPTEVNVISVSKRSLGVCICIRVRP